MVGEFLIEGLAEVPAGNQILVRLDLDLNGILKVTATERATGLAKHVVIDNAMERFRKQPAQRRRRPPRGGHGHRLGTG